MELTKSNVQINAKNKTEENFDFKNKMLKTENNKSLNNVSNLQLSK